MKWPIVASPIVQLGRTRDHPDKVDIGDDRILLYFVAAEPLAPNLLFSGVVVQGTTMWFSVGSNILITVSTLFVRTVFRYQGCSS